VTHPEAAIRPAKLGRLFWVNRVGISLSAIFLLGTAFYFWTAGSTYPLELNGAQVDAYNLLANAFLHLQLSVGTAPAALLHLQNPYDPAQNAEFQPYFHDLALYKGHFYLTWGPAPVIVLLVPLHIFGLEPSPSLTAAIFASAGLGFALLTLRALIRKIGGVGLGLCILAALALALSSAVPFILRRPSTYEEAVTGGYCFVMAGIWLATSALLTRRASAPRLVLMSLCFGLAAGARPTLGLAALVLVAVYLTLRPTQSRRRLLLTLAAPVAVCFVLLATYNQVRFGSPLEIGTRYQLAAEDTRTAPYAHAGYVPAGVWFYMIAPPRPVILFPFVELAPSLVSYPLGLPAHYVISESSGGLLPMTPIVVFLVALPWLWRRRPALLGALAPALLILAAVGLVIVVFLSYEFFAATERYEVDFTTLLMLGALAAWLTLSTRTGTRGVRRLVRASGALLIAWGCLTGAAVSFTGYYNLLAVKHPGTWTDLEDTASPVSAAIAAVVGHPVLAAVSAPDFKELSPITYTSVGLGTTAFGLGAGEQATLTIVSPDTREAALLVRARLNPALGPGASGGLLVSYSSHASSSYRLPAGGTAQIPVRLGSGVNHIALSALLGRAGAPPTAASPGPEPLLAVTRLSLAAHYCPSGGSSCR
jgi:hypothetical protein